MKFGKGELTSLVFSRTKHSKLQYYLTGNMCLLVQLWRNCYGIVNCFFSRFEACLKEGNFRTNTTKKSIFCFYFSDWILINFLLSFFSCKTPLYHSPLSFRFITSLFISCYGIQIPLLMLSFLIVSPYDSDQPVTWNIEQTICELTYPSDGMN